jgi:hypothetical protein
MFLGLPGPDPDSLVRGGDPDPNPDPNPCIILLSSSKKVRKTLISSVL